MSPKHKLTRRLVALTLAGAGVGVIGPSGLAEAAPSSCWNGFANNRNGYSHCSRGTGQHRVVVYCKYLSFWGGFTKVGPWRGINQQSWVECPWGTVITQIYTAISA